MKRTTRRWTLAFSESHGLVDADAPVAAVAAALSVPADADEQRRPLTAEVVAEGEEEVRVKVEAPLGDDGGGDDGDDDGGVEDADDGADRRCCSPSRRLRRRERKHVNDHR